MSPNSVAQKLHFSYFIIKNLKPLQYILKYNKISNVIQKLLYNRFKIVKKISTLRKELISVSNCTLKNNSNKIMLLSTPIQHCLV